MTVFGVPFYKNTGPHYTFTILACISAAVLPIPYALYEWDPKIREKSKYAVSLGLHDVEKAGPGGSRMAGYTFSVLPSCIVTSFGQLQRRAYKYHLHLKIG